jgi:hypothetical protein
VHPLDGACLLVCDEDHSLSLLIENRLSCDRRHVTEQNISTNKQLDDKPISQLNERRKRKKQNAVNAGATSPEPLLGAKRPHGRSHELKGVK